MDARAVWRWAETVQQVEARRELERRVREASAEWLTQLFPVDYFLTGTYDRQRLVERLSIDDPLPRVSVWKAERDGAGFIRGASKALGRPIAAVVCVEAHRDGSAHVHGLLGLGEPQTGDWEALRRLWFVRHGRVRLEAPRSPGDVAGYCAKYLTKDVAGLVFSPSLVRQGGLWRCGRGGLSPVNRVGDPCAV